MSNEDNHSVNHSNILKCLSIKNYVTKGKQRLAITNQFKESKTIQFVLIVQ
jgi:hypothetical protein